MKVLIVVASILVLVAANAVNLNGRISDGKNAKASQFPYQALLVIHHRDGKKVVCGGSLISNTWVLTAAHCVKNANFVGVALGTISLALPKVRHGVKPKDIIIHPQYNAITVKNDIALIKIPKTEFSNTIDAVRLPYIGDPRRNYERETAYLAGFGVVNNAGIKPVILQQATFTIASNDACERFRSTVTSTNICVEVRNGRAPCKGDSGGPLVLEKGRVQVGIASFGMGKNCLDNGLAVFTRVGDYLHWIKKHTGVP